MADLHFVDFALIPSPVRKERQFRLRDDFSEFDFTVLSHGRAIPRSVFPRFFEFVPHITDRPLFGDPRWFYTTRAKQEISTFPLSEVEFVAY